jgi:hypothetical protein
MVRPRLIQSMFLVQDREQGPLRLYPFLRAHADPSNQIVVHYNPTYNRFVTKGLLGILCRETTV